MNKQASTTRDNILQAALNLFASKGYHETSMSAVAESAGVGKGTLYWYFSSKDEMFRQVVNEKGEVLYEQLESLLELQLPADQVLRKLTEIKMAFIINNQKLSQILLNHIQSNDEEFKEKLMEKHKKIIEVVQKIMQRGIEENTFRSASALHMAVAFLGMTNSIGSLLLFDQLEDPQEMVDFIQQIALQGISNQRSGGYSNEQR